MNFLETAVDLWDDCCVWFAWWWNNAIPLLNWFCEELNRTTTPDEFVKSSLALAVILVWCLGWCYLRSSWLQMAVDNSYKSAVRVGTGALVVFGYLVLLAAALLTLCCLIPALVLLLLSIYLAKLADIYLTSLAIRYTYGALPVLRFLGRHSLDPGLCSEPRPENRRQRRLSARLDKTKLPTQLQMAKFNQLVHKGIFAPAVAAARRRPVITIPEPDSDRGLDIASPAIKRKAAKPVSTSTQTVEVKPAYVNAAVQTTLQPPSQTTCAVMVIMATQTVETQQLSRTNSATSSFSSIKAVHTIEPVPVPRPAIQTADAGVQVTSSDDQVTRDALKAQEDRHATEFAAFKAATAAAVKSIEDKHAAELRGLDARHAAAEESLKTAQAREIASLSSSHNTSSSALQTELASYKASHSHMRETMSSAGARYDVMEARVQSTTAENDSLKQQLAVSMTAAASGENREAVEQRLKQMQDECTRQLTEKDKDAARLQQAADARYSRVAADLKKAEAGNRDLVPLRQQVAVLTLQANRGKAFGGTTPGDGSMKNSGALKAELEGVTKERDELRGARAWFENGWKLCDEHRLKAVNRVGELETEVLRLRRAVGLGARTVMAQPALGGAAGKKRGAEEELGGGQGKRRHGSE